MFNGAYTIQGPQEKFKKFVYPRGNQFSNSVQMAEIGYCWGPYQAQFPSYLLVELDNSREGSYEEFQRGPRVQDVKLRN